MANTSQTGAFSLPGVTRPLRRTSTAIRVNQEEFNIQSAPRKIILRQLKEALLEQNIPAPFWAVLQVCDLTKLEYLVQLARLSLKIMDIITDLTCTLPYKWTQKPFPFRERSGSALATNSQHSTNGRSIVRWRPSPPRARYDARKRDQHRCVITGAGQVYHSTPIFPTAFSTSSLHDDLDFPSLWRFVDFFWGQSTAERWRKAVFSNRNDSQAPVNDCSNLICLRDDIRSAWSKGLFALRPFWKSEDDTQMDIEFYWQPKNDHKPYDLVDVMKEPVSSKDAQAVEQLNVVVSHRGRYNGQAEEDGVFEPLQPIKSGHRFRMTTDDPVARPLPNFDLLDMQWHFSRIVSFSNAATIFQYDDHDGDQDGENDDARTARPDDDYLEARVSAQHPNRDIASWLRTSTPPSSQAYSVDYIEDIDASMIGPLPGAEGGTDMPHNTKQRTTSLGSLSDSVHAFGHLSIGL